MRTAEVVEIDIPELFGQNGSHALELRGVLAGVNGPEYDPVSEIPLLLVFPPKFVSTRKLAIRLGRPNILEAR